MLRKITFDQWQNETNELLLDYAQEHGLHVDELNAELVAKVLHLRSEQWINYKAMMNELI